MATPLILMVHGFWSSPAVFDQVSAHLKKQGYHTQAVSLLGTGSVSPGNPSMDEDVAVIRKTITALSDQGHEIVLVLHSAGGFIGSNALKYLSRPVRTAMGLRGGVSRIVFVAAALEPEGGKLGQLPLTYVKDGALLCKDPKHFLFHDLDAADAEKWTRAMRPQPAEGWTKPVTYCGWREIPSEYIMCTQDRAISFEMQKQLVDMTGSRMHKLDAGHIPLLSQPTAVAEIIVSAARRTRPQSSIDHIVTCNVPNEGYFGGSPEGHVNEESDVIAASLHVYCKLATNTDMLQIIQIAEAVQAV